MTFTEKLEELDKQKFFIKEQEIENTKCFLIDGSIAEWTKSNLQYRSSIWTETGDPVSLSYKKFMNWGEKSNITQEPNNLLKCSFLQKIDGSTLIISLFKNTLLIRTRGSFGYENLENAFEVPILKTKYPNIFNNEYLISGNSIICEWVSPINKIVLDYHEADLYLTNIIRHKDYSYFNQRELDKLATELFHCPRPKWGTFGNNIEDMLLTINNLKGEEGYCVYFNNDQDIKKVKSKEYLAIHAFKSNIKDIESIIPVYIQAGTPNYNDFITYIETNFDHECVTYCQGYISKLLDNKKIVDSIIAGFQNFITKHKALTRKEFAQQVFNSYGKTERAGMIFKLLDHKPLDAKDLTRLFYQALKQ